MSEMQLGVTGFVSEIKRVGNYPDFEKLAHVIQHGLQGLIIKNIEGETTEANDLSRILYWWVCFVNNSNVTVQEAFEAVAQMNEELKRTEFDGAFCKKFKLLIDTFSSFFC